ncbi:MAG TPA: FAD-linked oxidase C-terminal domain-containing protein [Chloroflexota bacterium]
MARVIEKPSVVARLEAIVGPGNVLWEPYDLRLYEYDGSIDKARPDAVVLPTSAEQVAAIVRLCNAEGVPFTARGAGTGLSGGSVPEEGGVVLSFAKMNRILEIDLENLRAVVEPGVVNLHLTNAVQRYGLHFVPDPSSQKACTIGGNVGENSGGPHTLRYGVTTNHVVGLEVVLPNGEIVHTGGKALDAPGYDLTGLLVGSEGTLGIVTKAIVKLTPIAEGVKTLLGVFDTVEDASNTVSSVIARGIVPAALEMMDNLAIQAVERATNAGYPLDAGAVLLIEVEGLQEELDDLAELMAAACRENRAREVRVARTAKERELLWKGRKNAFGAMGRLSPDYYTMDGVIPRTRLPEVLAQIAAIGQRYAIPIANVFHAGDGNLHPLLLFDAKEPGRIEQVREAGNEILAVCARVGGSLSGEHGIGIEKRDQMPYIFGEADLATMREVKEVFDPEGRCNPGKIFPTPGGCAKMHPRLNMAIGW